MPSPSFEFDPFPTDLYSPDALLEGFDPDKPASYAQMRDARIYREFIVDGGAACGDYITTMGRSLHDNAITQALARSIGGKYVVAIMGGHAGSRRDAIYAETARLAGKLTAAGFTLASGGGPGIMEATHLGAAFGNDSGLEDALKELASPDVPEAIPANAGKIIKADGTFDGAIAEAMGLYLAPAVRILRVHGKTGGIGIPTWLYGHEPTTPFASSIGKYFQNSIREDGLLALATSGIIYMPGGAGTLQEVFQDAAQNYYKTFPIGPGKTGEFSPMIFYGDFWTTKIKVRPVLESLFGAPAKKPDRNVGNDYVDWVRYLTDLDEVIAHIQQFEAKPSAALELLSVRASLPPADFLDALLPSSVLIDTGDWKSGSALLTAYADGPCYNPAQTWNIPRANLSEPLDAGDIPTCDQTGSMRATRCTVQ